MLSPLLGAVLAIFIAYCVRWRIRTLNLFTQLKIPGPRPHFLWGNMWDIYKNGHMVMQKRWHKQYGPVVGYYLGMSPVVLVSDTELLKRILHTDFNNFIDRSEFVTGNLALNMEHALLNLKGQRWKEVRATLTPSFTTKKLRQINPMMSSCVDNFMKNVDSAFKNSAQCGIHDCYRALTLDTICKVGLGVDFKIQDDHKNSTYLRQAEVLLSLPLDWVVVIATSFPILIDLLGKLVLQLKYRLRNSGVNPVRVFRQGCANAVKLRRLNPEEFRRADLLQLMIDARSGTASATSVRTLESGDNAEAIEAETDRSFVGNPKTGHYAEKIKRLTDNEVIDNAFLLLIAGYETTSSTLGFLTRMLLRFPEVQERMRAELLEATDDGKVFDFERLQRCEYTEAVIQETLRMYSPIYYLTARVARENVKYGKLTIPKGVAVFSSVNEVHYNEKVFHEPYEFRPERFLPQNKTPAMAGSYQPFGSGPRNCIGMRFAQMEIKITMAKLLTKYRISSENEPKHESFIKTVVLPIQQRIKDPLNCKLEKL